MLKKLGIVGVIGLIAAFLVWKFVINKPIDNVASLKAAFTTTYDALSKEVNAGDSVAGVKYNDKIIEVTGVVKSIMGDDSTTTITIGDTTNTSDISIVCMVDARNNETAKGLTDGKIATIKGRFTGIDNQRSSGAPSEDGEEDVLADLGSISIQIKDAIVVKKK